MKNEVYLIKKNKRVVTVEGHDPLSLATLSESWSFCTKTERVCIPISHIP